MDSDRTEEGHPRSLGDGKYRLEVLIGRGATGTVYRAQGPDGVCAVKLRDDPDEQIKAARFLAEPIAMARIDHPGVVNVLDTGRDGGFLWIAMPFFEGGSLVDLVVANGPLSVEQACVLMEQVLEALVAVHAGGFVHRDVKPANIFLDGKGGAVLGDFGVAKHLTTKLWFRTQSGHGIGTAGFRAPEQDYNAKSAGPPADVFGAAATLYYITTGRRPAMLGGAEANLDVLAELPESLVEVVTQATRYEPSKRIGTAAEMLQMLRRIRDPEGKHVEPSEGVMAWIRGLFGG